MTRLTIGIKIGAGFLLSGLLLIVCGWAGFHVSNTLSGALNEISGTVRTTENAAARAMAGVRDELLGVDAILRGKDESGTATIQRAKEKIADASKQIRAGAIVPLERIAAAEAVQDEFAGKLNQLLEAFSRYTTDTSKLLANGSQLRDFMIDVERLASQAELENGLNEQANADATGADSWAVINAAGEARLALLKRLNFFHQIRQSGETDELRAEAVQTLEDLDYIAEDLAAAEIFSQELRHGPLAGKSYADALQQQLREHAEYYTAAVRSHIALQDLRNDYQEAADQVLSSYNSLVDAIRRVVQERVAEADDSADGAVRSVAVTVVLGLVAGIAAWLFSLRTIATPIRRASDQLQQIAHGDGDLNVALDSRGNDETTDLSMAFNAFTARLREIVASLRQSVSRLSDTAQQVTSIADQTEHQAEHQTGEVNSVAAAVNQLAASFMEVSGNTQKAADQASHADLRAREAQTVMDTTINAIQSGASEVVRAAGVVNDLESKSERIGGVLDVIRTISEQTNLLALNAAIEAARAGESGRGFAVVADEVRALARRTHDSIGEIQEMIDQLQLGTRQALDVMESARTLTEGSISPAHEAGEALGHITSAVREITDLNQHIAHASQEQQHTIREIERSMASISELASGTADQARSLNGSTENLSSVCQELRTVSQMFRA